MLIFLVRGWLLLLLIVLAAAFHYVIIGVWGAINIFRAIRDALRKDKKG